MSALISGFKTTALGGVLFLIPVTIAALVVIELVNILDSVTVPLADAVGATSVLGGVAANILGLVILGLICFGVGMFARGRSGQSVVTKVESGLMMALPGYAVIKGFADSLVGSAESARGFRPVMVKLAGYRTLAYEVERTESEMVVVFLPGSPNAMAGSIACVRSNQVDPVDMPPAELFRFQEQMGIGLGAYLPSTPPSAGPE